MNLRTNQLVFTDWASNLNRVADLMKEIDRPIDPATAKMVESSRKEMEIRRQSREGRKDEKPDKHEKSEQ